MNPEAVEYLQPGGLRGLNRRTVIDLIRFAPEGITRAALARRLGLSRAALTTIVQGLIAEGLVRESASGGETHRSVLLEINPAYGWVVGVDMGVTHLSILIADAAARIRVDEEYPFDANQGPLRCLEEIDEKVRRLVEQVGLTLADIGCIAVGVPGPIAGDGGMVISPPIMPGWDRYPIRDHLQSLWQVPVALSNDAELGALGEWAYGAGRSEHNLVYIKVGSGVGAGLILNDGIYRGTTGTAGEIGHVTVLEDGPLCSCGNQGCLEALAGGTAIARQARDAVYSGVSTQLSATTPAEEISAREVGFAARRGDLVAQRIFQQAGVYLGTTLAGLINLLNPGIVVIGGGVAQTGDLLLEPVRQTVATRCLNAAAQSVRINAAILGRRSSSLGAAVLAISEVLHKNLHPPYAAVGAGSFFMD